MTLAVKICGLSTAETLDAAIAGGAAMVGSIFFPRSPRYVDLETAKALNQRVPETVERVAVLINPSDEELDAISQADCFDLIQLHGSESPQRLLEVKQRTGLAAMKVIKVSLAEDLEQAKGYIGAADRLMFDTKPPAADKKALPGGNAIAFDWRLLEGRDWPLPWIVAGGLNKENLAQAVAISGTKAVDVSSGVEDAPGHKSIAKITAFLDLAKTL